MHGFVQHLYVFFAHLGGFGLLILGVLDSSFLFMPLGNDLLLVGLTAQNRNHWPYYAAMATAGSTLGCFVLDMISRKGGEAGLKKTLSPKRFEYVRKKISKDAAVALIIASLAPPPFPFTPVVAAAAAFEYSRVKLLTTIAVSRLVRFTGIALLALWLGSRILDIAKSPAVEGAILAFVALCVLGSGLSIFRWIQRSRTRA